MAPAPQSHPQAKALVVEGRVQVVVVLGGPAGQLVQSEPQLSTELSGRHCVPQRWKPVWQVKSQSPLTHVAVPFAGGVQVWQLVPHDAIELATHTLPQ